MTDELAKVEALQSELRRELAAARVLARAMARQVKIARKLNQHLRVLLGALADDGDDWKRGSE